MRNIFLTTVLALLLSLAVGCGGSNQSGANPNTPPGSASPGNPTTQTSPNAAQQDMTQPGASTTNPTTPGAPGTTTVVGPEISMLAMDYHSSLLKGDKARLEPILADEYKRTRDDGKVLNKSEELASLKKSEDMFSMEAQPAKINGDTAIVTGKITLRVKDKPDQTSGTWTTTDTFKKRNDKWVIVSSVEKKG